MLRGEESDQRERLAPPVVPALLTWPRSEHLSAICSDRMRSFSSSGITILSISMGQPLPPCISEFTEEALEEDLGEPRGRGAEERVAVVGVVLKETSGRAGPGHGNVTHGPRRLSWRLPSLTKTSPDMQTTGTTGTHTDGQRTDRHRDRQA